MSKLSFDILYEIYFILLRRLIDLPSLIADLCCFTEISCRVGGRLWIGNHSALRHTQTPSLLIDITLGDGGGGNVFNTDHISSTDPLKNYRNHFPFIGGLKAAPLTLGSYPITGLFVLGDIRILSANSICFPPQAVATASSVVIFPAF